MVLLAGPRQVGKTTFSFCFLEGQHSFGSQEDHPGYLNWDIPSKRKIILSDKLPVTEVLILDEIHKYKSWRNYLKGLYDLHKSRLKILVTGSAKLDIYRRSGDSLQGRYFFYRLHPLGPGEIDEEKCLNKLIKFGGFPEPFYEADEVFWQRWQNLRQKRLIEEDLIYLENVKDLSNIEILMSILPSRVGSLLSYNSLREDLSCSHAAVKNWMRILENLYFHYMVTPYTGTILKSIKKEAKLFLWDWSLAENKGQRHENFVASMLLKFCHFREDAFGEKMSLHFFRAKDTREVDFIVCKKGQPIFAVECKSNSTNLSPSFVSMRAHFPKIPFYQTHLNSNEMHLDHPDTGIEIIPLSKFIKKVLDL
jgi:uncharacterized protein